MLYRETTTQFETQCLAVGCDFLTSDEGEEAAHAELAGHELSPTILCKPCYLGLPCSTPHRNIPKAILP